MDYRQKLLTIAGAYAKAKDLSLARIGTLVHNQGAFFDGLAQGKGCTVDTYEKVMQWFSDRWPEGTEWPSEISRPTPRPVDDQSTTGAAA